MNGQRTKRAAAPPWYGRTLLAGVIDVVDFAAARNGERDINPAKLVAVVETFSPIRVIGWVWCSTPQARREMP